MAGVELGQRDFIGQEDAAHNGTRSIKLGDEVRSGGLRRRWDYLRNAEIPGDL